MKVNLIYDYRQQATSRLKQVDGVIDDSRSSYDTLKAEFKSRKEEFEKEKSAFASLAASFEKRNDEYQRQVSAWNTQGGAPKNDYNRLQTEQKALQVESRQLQIKQSALNDLLDEISKVVERDERILVTTLTKRMAEELTKYFAGLDIRCRYIHSDIDTMERVEILQDLRKGIFDVLVGINLLREGLDHQESRSPKESESIHPAAAAALWLPSRWPRGPASARVFTSG